MVFCNLCHESYKRMVGEVTILILVDGFLQFRVQKRIRDPEGRHNPYFSRWFSAIRNTRQRGQYLLLVTILILVDGFLQYEPTTQYSNYWEVTILILVDGFLQSMQKTSFELAP